MAGYLFSIGKKNNKPNFDTLFDFINKGVYSTIISTPNTTWRLHQEGTFADYFSMKEGDNVYFFIDRKIYGIGRLININGDCKFLNYPNANQPSVQNYGDVRTSMLYDNGVDTLKNRFICTFESAPHFFQNGIDMDEVLFSAPEKFKILRAFQNLSFIKFSETENQGFKDIILRRNIDAINLPNEDNVFNQNIEESHNEIREQITGNNIYSVDISPILNTINNPNGSLSHEMAVEAALIFQLNHNKSNAREIFGTWDYLSHQVIASPFKPLHYIDKMDVFGYNFIPNQKPTICNYLVVEIKRGEISSQDILQLMKYVDWIKNEYAYGDYSMIKAFMLGYSYTEGALEDFSKNIERRFIKGVRPSISTEWKDVKLIQYRYNEATQLLDFTNITPDE